MKRRFWLSYDIRSSESIEELYRWLARNKAVECVNDLASFIFDGDKKQVQQELITKLNLTDKDRLYLIYKKDNNSMAGTFIYGNRNSVAPWDSYAVEEEVVEDEEFLEA